MTKFVNIYQRVIKQRTLRDDIPAVENSIQMQELLRITAKEDSHRKALLQKMRDRDNQAAKLRLEKLRTQLLRKDSNAS